jgi:hypothetical protein
MNVLKNVQLRWQLPIYLHRDLGTEAIPTAELILQHLSLGLLQSN